MNCQYHTYIFCWILLIQIVSSKGIEAFGQMQLVLMKNEKVTLRLNPGDEFIYKLKNSKTVKRTYVNNLSDTAVVTHSDVVPFHAIDRIYFHHLTFYNKVGTALVLGGSLLFLIDQFNVAVVQDNGFSLDQGVSVASLTMVGVGLPMMLIKKKSQRLRGRHRIRMVKKGSPFYKENPHSFIE